MRKSCCVSARALSVTWAVLILAMCPAEATELRVSMHDTAGAPVAIEKAQVILTTWGETERVDLPVEHNRVVVPLDAGWPLTRLAQVDYAHLYLELANHVPVMSEPFEWLGQTEIRDGKSVKIAEAEIRFQDGTAVRVPDGAAKDLRLVARRPTARWVKLVDPEGRPVPGVRVSQYLFWSSRCHTGFMMGSELWGEATTGRKGRIRVKDADVEYAFQIQTPHCIFQEPPPRGPDFRNEVTTRLEAKETVLVVRNLKPRRLELIVTGPDGQPAAGATLFGSVFGYEAVRSPWSGPVASADASGRIRMRDFYPDECGRLFFCDTGNKAIWKIDPADLPAQGPLAVKLPSVPAAD